jgi:archaellum component FlaG (FlaF/FlaG flagellin family)
MKKNCIFTVILALVFGLSGCDTGETVDNTDKKGTIFVYAGAASSLEIAHNSKGFTFPDTYIGESAEVTMVVKNTGRGVIKMTGVPYVNLDGATAVFSVSSALETSIINPGSSASFKIKFSPVNTAESYVYVSIPNNSENTPDFSFSVYGTGLRPKPTASIFYGDYEIPQNGTINAGQARITQSKVRPVIIKNTGREVLTIDTGNITISGADAAAFTQTTNPGGSVSVGSQTFFNIEYKPVRQGENNAVLTIPTNDNARNPVIVYLRTIAGAAPKPTASVFFGDNEIPQNGTINAGIVVITLSKNIAVVIKNTGEETLTLDTADITITGTDAEVFRKITNPAGSISVGEQTSFIISCEPVEQGENDAVLTIPTNDNSRNPVVVYLRMTAEKGAAILKLSQDNDDIGNNSITPFDFGRVSLDSNKPLVFTIKNDGNITLELTGNPAVESSNIAFTIPTQPASKTISPGADVLFLLRYTPTDEKEDAGTITIYSNSDDRAFTLNVKGTGYVKRPQITVKQGNSTVNQYGEYDFGTVALGENKDITFDIENTGEANLSIISVNGSRINLEDDTDIPFFRISTAFSRSYTGKFYKFHFAF